MPGTGIDPGDPGSILRGLRRSRDLTLEDVAGVLGVGPETLALLEAGEWGSVLDDPQGEILLADYARVLGLDNAVVRDWLEGAMAGSSTTAGAGARGRPPLSGSARFARFKRFERRVPPVVPPTAPQALGGPKEPHAALSRLLMTARVRAGLTQADAARLLSMRLDFVAAMDRGDVDRLPRGHERSMLTRYALLVGLQPALALEAFVGHEPQAWPRPRAGRKRIALWIRFSGGVLIVAGLVLAAISVS